MAVILFCSGSLMAQTGKYGVGTNDVFKGVVGLQTYSLRDTTKTDPVKTLDLTVGYGFKYIEIDSNLMKAWPKDELLKQLKKRNIVPIAAHWGFGDLAKDPEAVAKEAKAYGLEAVGCAWAKSGRGDLTEKEVRKIADVFNKAGAAMAKEGLKFYYHNHGYEFQPYKNGTLFDLLAELTDPKLVYFQLDVLWTIFPGQDPVALMKKYPNRWLYLHLKDLRKGVEGNLSGGTPHENDVVLGTGQADYSAILKTAQELGVKYYFIEDENPAVIERLPQSIKYLESVRW